MVAFRYVCDVGSFCCSSFLTIYIQLFWFGSSLWCFHHHSAKMEMNSMKRKAVKKSKPILCLRLPFWDFLVSYSELLRYCLRMLSASGLVLSEAFFLIIKFISSTEKRHHTEKCSIYNFKKFYWFIKHFQKLFSS